MPLTFRTAQRLKTALRWQRFMLPLLLLAGCNTLPDSGPVESQILNSASDPHTNPLGFHIVPIDMRVVSVISAESPPLMSALDTGRPDPAEGDRIGAGDLLTISVFEIGSSLFGGGASGGSASPTPGPSATATTETLPPVQVDSYGNVQIPYVGTLRAAGRTPAELATAIQGLLAGESQKPQVLVRVTSDVANSVIISGDVQKPGRDPLTLAHERLLDMVAIAGGPTHAEEDTFIQLTRGDQTNTIPLKTLEESPDQNIVLLPGDHIQVTYRPRTFTVFGATSTVSQTPFAAATLSLAEALARIGGPLDNRADPNAVFLLRFETPAIAQRLGLPAAQPGLSGAPVIYQLDMMDPTSYFLAQQFAMKDKDLIYIANAKSNKVYKFMNLISLIAGPAITTAVVARQ